MEILKKKNKGNNKISWRSWLLDGVIFSLPPGGQSGVKCGWVLESPAGPVLGWWMVSPLSPQPHSLEKPPVLWLWSSPSHLVHYQRERPRQRPAALLGDHAGSHWDPLSSHILVGAPKNPAKEEQHRAAQNLL